MVDKPVAQYAVEEAAAAGVEEVIFVTGQAKRAIEDHFDKNFELEYLLQQKGKTELLAKVREISDIVQFAYVRQKEMLGLGHAILQARNLVNDEPFAVLLPDDVYTGSVPAIGELIEVHKKTGTPVIGVKEVPIDAVSRYGIVAGEEIESGLLKMTEFVEKPARDKAPSRYAAMGRYVFDRKIFDHLDGLEPGAGGEIQITDAVREYMKDNAIHAALMEASHHDAGEVQGYLKTIVDLALERDDLRSEFAAWLKERLKAE